MKITKKELSQIIKEEAQRFITIKKLEAEKTEIERQLNESYMEEYAMEEDLDEGVFGKIGAALSKGADKVQKAGAEAIVSDKEKAAGKKDFDEELGKVSPHVEKMTQNGWKFITVSKDGKKIEGFDENALREAAEQYAYQGRLVRKQDKNKGTVILHFVATALTGASPQGHDFMKEEGMISESVIRKMIKEEAEKMEKAKELKARAEEIKNQLKNL
jgi:hypothetical protein